MDDKPKFEMDLLTSNHYLSQTNKKPIQWSSDLEHQIAEKKDTWYKDNTFAFREKILFNNLNSSFIKDLQVSLSDLYYFQHYYTATQDFDSVNYDHLQFLRHKFLSSLSNEDEMNIKNQSGDNAAEVKEINDSRTILQEYYMLDKAKSPKDCIVEIASNLISVISFNGENEIKQSIMLRLLDNIHLELKNTYAQEILHHAQTIEEHLLLFIEEFEKRMLINIKEVTRFLAEIILKIKYIALYLHSSILFLRTLMLIRKLNLSFNNFQFIKHKFFKYTNTMNNFKSHNEKLTSIHLMSNVIYENAFSINDSQFIFTLVQMPSSCYCVLYKLKLNTLKSQPVIVLLEKNILLNYNTLIKLINSPKEEDNELMIVSCDELHNFEVITINKQSLITISSIRHTIPKKVLNNNTNIIRMTNSKSYLFLFWDKTILKIRNYTSSEPEFTELTYNQALQVENGEEKVSGFLKETKNSFCIGDELIYFTHEKKLIVYHILKNIFKQSIPSVSTNSKNKLDSYYNNNTNHFITTKKESDNGIKITVHLNQYLAMENWDDCFFAQTNLFKEILNEKHPLRSVNKLSNETNYIIDESGSIAYFNYLFLLLAKHFYYFGNISNSYCRSVAIDYNKQRALIQLNKWYLSKTFISNTTNTHLFNLLLNSPPIEKNSQLKEVALSMLQSVLRTYYYFSNSNCNSGNNTDHIGKYHQIYEWIFDNLDKENYFNSYLAIKNNTIYNTVITFFSDKMNKYLNRNDDKLSFQKRLLYTCLLRELQLPKSEKKNENDLAWLNTLFDLELQVILEKNCINNFILSKFQLLKEKYIKSYSQIILNWDCNFNNTDTIEYKIVNKSIEQFTSLIQKLKPMNRESRSNSIYINSSCVCQLLYLIVNVIINHSLNHSNYSLSSYYSHIINVIIELDQYTTSHSNQSSHNLANEEMIIVESDHPFNLDQSKQFILAIKDNNTHTQLQFDSLSEMNPDSKLSIDSFGLYSKIFPSEAISIKEKDSGNVNININYQPNTLKRKEVNDKTVMAYGYKMKIWNYDVNPLDINSNCYYLLTEIKQALIYSIGGLLYNQLNKNSARIIKPEFNCKMKNEKEDQITKILFSSKLLENISIIDSHNEEAMKSNQPLSIIENIINTSIKDQVTKAIQSNFILIPNGNGNNNVDDSLVIVNKIRNNTDDCFKFAIDYIHKQFISNVVWGNIIRDKSKHLIICLFSIVLKHEQLLLPYQQFANELYAQRNNTELNSLTNNDSSFKLFLKIYTEVSKIKRWIKEQEGKIDRSDLNNNQLIEDNQIIDISSLITNLTAKAEFLLKALKNKPRLVNNKEIFESSLNKNKGKEYTQNIQDIIDNLLLYIQSNEIEVSKLVDRIAEQNQYSLQKEYSLAIMNIALSLSSNQQNIKDLIYWANKISKKDINNSIVDLTHDLYGADPIYTCRVKKQLYTYLSILFTKLRETNNESIEDNRYDISYYYTLTQAIAWKLRKRDHQLIQDIDLFEVFESRGILSKLLFLNQDSSQIDTTCEYGCTRININSLSQEVFKVFSLYTLIVFDKFNQPNPNCVSENKSILSWQRENEKPEFKRKVSEIDEIESLAIISQISNIIFSFYDNYISLMVSFTENKTSKDKLINEEKLNDFLLLFYKALSFNNKLIKYFISNYPKLLSTFIQIMLNSSEKNRFLCLKLIEQFTIEYNDQFINTSIKHIKNILQKHNAQLYSFIMSMGNKNNCQSQSEVIDSCSQSSNYFYILFLFKYVFLLLNSHLYSYIFKTECDIPLAWSIIYYIRTLLLSESSNFESTILYLIEKIVDDSSSMNDNDLSSIALFVLGVDLSNIQIGSKVVFDYFNRRNKNKDITLLINDFESNKTNAKVNYGIVIGFTDYQNKLFSYDDMNQVSIMKNYYLKQKRYAIVLPEEMINKQNISTLSFNNLLFVEVNNIELYRDNMFNQASFLLKAINSKIISSIVNQIKTLKPQLCYLSLSFIKIILTSKEDIGVKKYKILTQKNIDHLTQLAISTLDSQGELIPLELLETTLLSTLCVNTKEDNNETESAIKQKEDHLITQSKSTIDNDKQQILISGSSYFLKINNNLIIESVYSKIFNYAYFPNQEKEAFLPLHQYDCTNTIKKGYDYVMVINSNILSKEAFDNIKQNENEIRYLITNNQLNEDTQMIKLLTSTITIPIITIEDKDYSNHFDFIFSQVTNEELEGLFMRSIQKDYTSLIDIPCHMVDDSGYFDQRNIVLKVLKEDKPLESAETSLKASSSTSIPPELFIQKLISLISRRIVMIYLSKTQRREKAHKDTIITILKLLLFESNIFQYEREKKLNDNLASESIEINTIIKDYLYNMSSKVNEMSEWDIAFIRTLLDMPFSNSVNYVDCSVLSSIGSEKKLLEYIVIENNVKVIFSLLPQVMQLPNIFDIKQYRMQLFNCFLLKLNIFKIKSNATFMFIVDVLIMLLKQIMDKLTCGDAETITTLSNFAFIFFSAEFIELAKDTNELMVNTNEKEMSNSEFKLINFIFVYFDLALKALITFKINLNLNLLLKSKIMNTYLIYSLMINKNKEMGLFLLFCKQRGLFEYSNITSQPIICDLSYYDPSFSLPHLIGFKCDNCHSVEIKVKNIDEKLIGIDNVCFIYADRQCNYLQDYIRSDQNEKKVMIKNQDNCFFISYPYSKFKNNLYGSGSNDHQSLGCGGELSANYTLPQQCKGLENAKSIVDFKFGYYHTFVQVADGNLFVCGDDNGSSIKDSNRPTSKFILESYFQDIAQKTGIVGIWVNNYNATILVTKTNGIYGCGLNHEYCLTSIIEKEKTVSVPFKMPSIKEKVILVACGFKSSLFVLEDGTAKSVGCNKYYQCGQMDNNIDTIKEYYHIIPPNNGKIKHAVSGEDYFLLIIDEPHCKGRLYSLGGNQNGKCGIGQGFVSQLQKCKGVEGFEFKVIYSRNDSSAAITSTGDLYTFGYNKEGNLGIGNKQDQYKPVYNEALSGYICDDVAISHHHMLVIARSKTNGEKKVFSAGTNEFLNLGIDDNKENIFTLPEEIKFFKQKEFSQQPIRVSVSRYQSYFLTIETIIHNDACVYSELRCVQCSKEIENVIFFEQKDNKTKVYYCQQCIDKMKNVFIMFTSSTPFSKSKIETIEFNQSSYLSAINDLYVYENKEESSSIIMSEDYKYKCIKCNGKIVKDNMLLISQDNRNFILCAKCYLSKMDNCDYPQIFFVFYNILPHKTLSQLPKIKDLSSQLWNIKHTDKPYLSLEITKKYSFYEEFIQLSKNQIMKEMCDLWITLSNTQIRELNKLKEALESEAKDRNDYSLIDSIKLFKAIKDLSTTKQYQSLLMLSFDQITLLYELLELINNDVYNLISIKTNSNASSFIHKAISENIELINSKERLMIFSDKLEKLKVNIEPHDKKINLSRMKASKFYEKNQIDTGGDNTLFCQLFQQMKGYPPKNYLSKKEIRLFTVVLEGEGATDYGGPYCDVLSAICDELQSNHLDLFIKTPNNKNEIGSFRDKYIPNPSSISLLHKEMYLFIGYLCTHAISSCHLLNLNLHPIVWNLILGLPVDWEMISSIDYLFYKYINEIDVCSITAESEFDKEYDINFVIQLSNADEYELIPNGNKTKVTLANKNSFTTLAKAARLNEFSTQIFSIKNGITENIPENLLLLLTPKELDESVCGKAIINIAILKQYTEYQGFTSDHPTIEQFWKAMEVFSNDERILYLKYVWGRTRLPDPQTFPFVHVISLLHCSNSDNRLPTAGTCYFTLKLPKYSSYEILLEKLRYAITNCSEIDTDFTVRN